MLYLVENTYTFDSKYSIPNGVLDVKNVKMSSQNFGYKIQKHDVKIIV